jgi:CHAD domain-containing protein
VTATSAIETTRETERKYEAADGVRLPHPSRLPGLDTGQGAEDQQLEAVYFDTSDLRLANAGITLRRRTGGSDPGWHLKLPAGEDSRDELRLPLGRARRRPPAELISMTRVHTRGAPLTPVALLATRRRRWLLTDGDGRRVAELVEDRVDGKSMNADAATDQVTMSWVEIEVELTEHGSPALLDRIEHELVAAGAQRSASPSKLGRLLADRLSAPADVPELTAASSTGEVVLGYLRDQTAALRHYDPLVRREAPDAVHRMRVSTRRMRSALQAFGRVLDRDATRSLTDELKWLAGELAPARDTEVTADRFADVIGELPPELVLGPVSAAVDHESSRRQVDARQRTLAALDSDRYLALHGAIDTLLADPPLTKAAGNAAGRELPRHVSRAYRRMKRRMREVERQPAGESRDLALHETRKAAKRLRYATEAAAPAVGKPARRLRKGLKPVQKLLGDHQDTVVARPVLRELAAQAHLNGGNGFTFGLMHGLEADRAARAERRLPARWKRMTRPKNVRWLRR